MKCPRSELGPQNNLYSKLLPLFALTFTLFTIITIKTPMTLTSFDKKSREAHEFPKRHEMMHHSPSSLWHWQYDGRHSGSFRKRQWQRPPKKKKFYTNTMHQIYRYLRNSADDIQCGGCGGLRVHGNTQ